MVTVVPDRYGGDASHGRVLDRSVRRSRAAWHPGGAGECAAHQKRTRAKNRCAGMPMADETGHLQAATGLLPAAAGDGKYAHDLAPTSSERDGSGTARAVHAESVVDNEQLP